MLFSIIVPIYNTPIDFLEKCFASIQAQSFDDYEVILVDDGSNVECAEWLDVFVEKDKKFKVIHKTNGGASSARNVGMCRVKGEYVIFIDADDWIPEGYFASANDYIKKYHADIIYGTIAIPVGADLQNSGTVELFEQEQIQEIKKSMLDCRERKLKYRILWSVYGRVYRSSCLESLRFPEGVAYGEDQYFSRCALNQAKKVLVVPDVWYYYKQNDFSATHRTIKQNSFIMIKNFFDFIYELDQADDSGYQTALAQNAVGLFFSMAIPAYIGNGLKYKEKIQQIKQLAQHPYIVHAIKQLKGKKELNLKLKLGRFVLAEKWYSIAYLMCRMKNM